MATTKTRDRPGAQELRALRLKAKLSQQRLAELADCSLASVGLFESGYMPERSSVLERLLAVLTEVLADPHNDHDRPAKATVEKESDDAARIPK